MDGGLHSTTPLWTLPGPFEKTARSVIAPYDFAVHRSQASRLMSANVQYIVAEILSDRKPVLVEMQHAHFVCHFFNPFVNIDATGNCN